MTLIRILRNQISLRIKDIEKDLPLRTKVAYGALVVGVIIGLLVIWKYPTEQSGSVTAMFALAGGIISICFWEKLKEVDQSKRQIKSLKALDSDCSLLENQPSKDGEAEKALTSFLGQIIYVDFNQSK